MKRVDEQVTLFLSGDVMLGRGVDQVLPHPVDPELRESYVADARRYVELAETANGPIPHPTSYDWPWGSALATLDRVAPDVRVINLETSITTSGAFAPGKAVCYRMSPDNVPSVAAGQPDICVLANNHVLDFGEQGLLDTLDTLHSADLPVAGAGPDAATATRPAVAVAGKHRVLVVAYGCPSSGVPPDWAATAERPGIAVLPELSDAAAMTTAERVLSQTRPGDVAIVSIHWGSNWGYNVPRDQVRFAHRLIDEGVHLVHGHSSHHPRPIEIYRGRLILYGCGDLINDYEGIDTRGPYRDDLRLLYFPSLHPATGALTGLRMAVMQARQLRLHSAADADIAWTRATLTRASSRFDTHLAIDPTGMLIVGTGF